MTLSLTTAVNANWSVSETQNTVNSFKSAETENRQTTYADSGANGTTVHDLDTLVVLELTLSAGGFTDIDLNGLSNVVGEDKSLATVNYVHVYNTSGTSGDTLGVGGATANPVTGIFGAAAASTHVQDVPPLGSFVFNSPIDGVTVTNGVNDTLRITNNSGSNSVTAEVYIGGSV